MSVTKLIQPLEQLNLAKAWQYAGNAFETGIFLHYLNITKIAYMRKNI